MRFVAEADGVERLKRACLGRRAARAANVERDADVFLRGQRRKQVESLEHEPEPSRRTRGSSRSGSLAMSRPPTITCPDVGRRIAPMIEEQRRFRCPTAFHQQHFLRRTSRSTPLSACVAVAPLPHDLVTCSTMMPLGFVENVMVNS